jgi:hypothetical protein
MGKNVWPHNHEYVYISIIQYVHLGKSGRKQYRNGIPWPSEGFSVLLSTGMIITTVVSDRHASIAKWMREECTKLCKEMKKKS